MINIQFVGAERLLELANGPELFDISVKTSRLTTLRICVQAYRANLGPIGKGLLQRKLEDFDLKPGHSYLIDPDYNLLLTPDRCESDEIKVDIVI